ncbi:MAG: 16S rRNA (cytidine(1402)-2'-O)-methyltransferase [Oscillospiraceae bacterium]|jgi:16S rRNA (cytidine1402-2'-O)-methyltransferase
MAGTLYLVGTPIGNLGDLSPRAAETLEKVDFIAAEDTRVTLKLLAHLGIKKELVSYHEHNRRQRGPQILERLQQGESCALCSDAGMPCISDPGEELVRLCAEQGILVQSVPGPTAAMTALALSGLSAGRFAFEGFLSVKKGSREEHLASLKEEQRTLVFYEAPHKLPATLKDLLRVLGDRKIALCRELTKLYEEVHRTTLAQAVAYYEEHPPRGEFVLVVEGASPLQESQVSREEALALVRRFCKEGMSLSGAAREAARLTGYQKGELYRAAALQEE